MDDETDNERVVANPVHRGLVLSIVYTIELLVVD